jgi:hypothetical protein
MLILKITKSKKKIKTLSSKGYFLKALYITIPNICLLILPFTSLIYFLLFIKSGKEITFL